MSGSESVVIDSKSVVGPKKEQLRCCVMAYLDRSFICLVRVGRWVLFEKCIHCERAESVRCLPIFLENLFTNNVHVCVTAFSEDM